jgi:hypothetical protein
VEGGGPRSQVQLPDGHDRGAQIDGSRMAPTLSAALSLTRMGPPSAMSSFCPPFPCCRVPLAHPSSLARVALPSSHHPLFARHASRFFHISLSPEGESVSLSSPHLPGCPLPRVTPCYLPLSSLSLLDITPTIHHVLRDGPHVRPSSYSVVPGGSARSIPYPEMLSWLGYYQSQEAVIEAVGGG